MISDFRNRLRKPSVKSASSSSGQPGDDLPDPVDETMAWERSTPDILYETRSQVTPVEAEWREKIYQQLLKVMDLSLLDSLEQAEAARQIRDICQRLLDEHSAPVSTASRQLIIKQITDEVLGLGPLEPLLADHSVSDILVNRHDSVYVERFGKLQRTDVRFRDDQPAAGSTHRCRVFIEQTLANIANLPRGLCLFKGVQQGQVHDFEQLLVDLFSPLGLHRGDLASGFVKNVRR